MAITLSKTKLALLTLTLVSQTVLAQSIDWGAFSSGISDNGGSGGTSSGSTTVVTTESGLDETNSVQNASCGITKDKQTTLPLFYLNKLSSGKGFFKMSLDPVTDRVSIQSDLMIANCNDMLEVKTSKTKTAPFVHMLAVGIKGGKTVADFEKCIAEKVMTDGKVDPKKVERGTLSLNYSFDQSGEFKFLSEGPLALDQGGVYGSVDYKGCLAVEPIAKDGFMLKTVTDRDKEQRSKYVAGLCQTSNYKDISDELISKYQDYKGILEQLRNELLLAEVKKLSKDIQTGDDLSGLDFSVIGDFQKYIIDPITEDIRLTYQELKGATGDQKKILEKKLKELKTKLGTFKKTPYLTESDFNKLKAKGQFDACDELFALRTTIVEFEKVANIEDGNKRVTPEFAKTRIKNAIHANAVVMKEERLKYQLSHGEVTGKAAQYSKIATQLRNNIDVRTKNYTAAMQKTMQQAYKKCSMYFVNKQKCMNKYARKIQSMQITLTNANNRDSALADKLTTKSQEYATLEQQGREYRRNQDDEGTSSDNSDIYAGITIENDLTPDVDSQFDFSDYSDQGNQFYAQGQNNQYQQQQGGNGFNFNQNQIGNFQFNDQNRQPAYYPQNNYGYNQNYNQGYSPFTSNFNFGAGSSPYYGNNNFGSSPYGQYYQQPVYGQQYGQNGQNGFQFGQFGY